MVKKNKIKHFTLEDDYVDDSFDLYGISCHSKDYQLCFSINRLLGFSLIREDDIILNQQNVEFNFSRFSYFNQDNNTNYHFIQNKLFNQFLLPQYHYADYLWMIQCNIGKTDQHFTDELKKINIVLTMFKINSFNLASKDRLLF